ncbi:MAG: hypothetical protein GY797_41390 [Deltaproteobacteria bacterium]|nr:hypothetical protein [Deltaproteobacteria bacterium]
MCGIFGLTVSEQSGFTPELLLSTTNELFKLSESRGKEAAGVAVYEQDSIEVYKDAVSATSFIHSRPYKKLFEKILKNGYLTDRDTIGQSISLIGHSRLVTNGAMEIHDNNQPVIADGVVGIHNGIIVNDEHLWQTFPSLQRHYEVDTEVILTLIRHFYDQTNLLTEAIRSTFELIEGTASIAVFFEDLDVLVLATNNGSLYTCTTPKETTHFFASERYILHLLTQRSFLRHLIGKATIQQVKPGSGCIIDITSARAETFSLDRPTQLRQAVVSNGHPTRHIVDVTPPNGFLQLEAEEQTGPTIIPDSIFRRFTINQEPIKALRRCARCVLPETMPYIEFDDEGVCNYCRNYRKIEVKGHQALMETLDQYRSRNGEPDCLVTFSGGRDSSFGVHYVKTMLKMNPITYTYDWGMVTDLARRNQARLCGKLGLEHILVSADIKRKRQNICKNVLAWLKRPDLGTVPLFMAGDKQYFYHANRLRKQTGVEVVILCENLLETTNFKSGFCGLPPAFGAEHTYTLSMFNKMKMAAYYGKQYLLNPAYLNSSVMDTLGAFASYYIIPHNYLNMFDYIRWDEETITSTLIHEYDWEIATDTNTTWRIGDGTAAFYNYIYYCVAGFSENDTFRSNQIREGMISREQAIEFIYEENQPRFESIQWYCDTIGIGMESALDRIISIPRLYT